MFKSESDQSQYMIPLMLDLSASSVLIVGCGAVGQRKAGYFADSCREVFQIDELPKNPEELISRYDIIVAATASESLNETICSIARSQNKWYNSATGIGNFLIRGQQQPQMLLISIFLQSFHSQKSNGNATFAVNRSRRDNPVLQSRDRIRPKGPYFVNCVRMC